VNYFHRSSFALVTSLARTSPSKPPDGGYGG
jgi:hypothetical protein